MNLTVAWSISGDRWDGNQTEGKITVDYKTQEIKSADRPRPQDQDQSTDNQMEWTCSYVGTIEVFLIFLFVVFTVHVIFGKIRQEFHLTRMAATWPMCSEDSFMDVDEDDDQ